MNNDYEEKIEDVITSGAKKAAGDLIVKTFTPASEELGKGIATIAKTVNVLLTPLSAVIWGYEKICKYVEISVAEKLKGIDAEKITQPAINVVGPAIEALRFSSENEVIRDLFSGLIATAMNSETKDKAHPSYVEIIKQLSPDEALILRKIFLGGYYPEIAGIFYDMSPGHDPGSGLIRNEFAIFCNALTLNNSSLISSYFDNLLRLRLFEIQSHSVPKLQKNITDNYDKSDVESTHMNLHQSCSVDVLLTDFGENFLAACIYE